jgi:hypothetical protein
MPDLVTPTSSWARRGAIALLMGLLLALSSSACGGDDNSGEENAQSDAVNEPPDVLVQPDQVTAYPPDSPQAAVLEWWRAVQFNDLSGVKDAYLPSVDLPNLERALLLDKVSTSRPVIVDAQEQGDEATVYTIIETYSFSGQPQGGRRGQQQQQPLPGREPVTTATKASEESVAFSLKRLGEDWKFEDNRYLDRQVVQAVQSLAKGREQQAGGGEQQAGGQGQQQAGE